MRIGFLFPDAEWRWDRQLSDSLARRLGVTFGLGVHDPSDDWLVVFNRLRDPVETRLPKERLIYIASEPPIVASSRPEFMAQFGTVLTTDRGARHPNPRFTQIATPWWVGAFGPGMTILDRPLGYDDFKTFDPPKPKLISVVTSKKAFTEGHRARLRFVSALQSHFGGEMDVFGRGVAGFDDKLEVLRDYRYHIAIENSAVPDYWTEKIADCYLTRTFPIYYGCPNLADYFPEASFARIDIADPRAAIQTIERVITEKRADHAGAALEEARRRVLDEHNMFAVLARLTVGSGPRPALVAPTILKPEKAFAPTPSAAADRVARWLRRLPGVVLTRWRVGEIRRQVARNSKKGSV